MAKIGGLEGVGLVLGLSDIFLAGVIFFKFFENYGNVFILKNDFIS
jgi:hypothetical protein